MNKPVARKLRCAVYTRKSTEEGLDMAFNSLDAQREACEAYVASQKPEGWIPVPDRYDDGGFSGGTLERPALKRLPADIEIGKVDLVVGDKVAASRKKGIWMGGFVPLGYRAENRKLVIDEKEVGTVRMIFERFVKIGSATALAKALIAEGATTRSGKLIDKGVLYKLLNNR